MSIELHAHSGEAFEAGFRSCCLAFVSSDRVRTSPPSASSPSSSSSSSLSSPSSSPPGSSSPSSSSSRSVASLFAPVPGASDGVTLPSQRIEPRKDFVVETPDPAALANASFASCPFAASPFAYLRLPPFPMHPVSEALPCLADEAGASPGRVAASPAPRPSREASRAKARRALSRDTSRENVHSRRMVFATPCLEVVYGSATRKGLFHDNEDRVSIAYWGGVSGQTLLSSVASASSPSSFSHQSSISEGDACAASRGLERRDKSRPWGRASDEGLEAKREVPEERERHLLTNSRGERGFAGSCVAPSSVSSTHASSSASSGGLFGGASGDSEVERGVPQTPPEPARLTRSDSSGLSRLQTLRMRLRGGRVRSVEREDSTEVRPPPESSSETSDDAFAGRARRQSDSEDEELALLKVASVSQAYRVEEEKRLRRANKLQKISSRKPGYDKDRLCKRNAPSSFCSFSDLEQDEGDATTGPEPSSRAAAPWECPCFVTPKGRVLSQKLPAKRTGDLLVEMPFVSAKKTRPCHRPALREAELWHDKGKKKVQGWGYTSRFPVHETAAPSVEGGEVAAPLPACLSSLPRSRMHSERNPSTGKKEKLPGPEKKHLFFRRLHSRGERETGTQSTEREKEQKREPTYQNPSEAENSGVAFPRDLQKLSSVQSASSTGASRCVERESSLTLRHAPTFLFTVCDGHDGPSAAVYAALELPRLLCSQAGREGLHGELLGEVAFPCMQAEGQAGDVAAAARLRASDEGRPARLGRKGASLQDANDFGIDWGQSQDNDKNDVFKEVFHELDDNFRLECKRMAAKTGLTCTSGACVSSVMVRRNELISQSVGDCRVALLSIDLDAGARMYREALLFGSSSDDLMDVRDPGDFLSIQVASSEDEQDLCPEQQAQNIRHQRTQEATAKEERSRQGERTAGELAGQRVEEERRAELKEAPEKEEAMTVCRRAEMRRGSEGLEGTEGEREEGRTEDSKVAEVSSPGLAEKTNEGEARRGPQSLSAGISGGETEAEAKNDARAAPDPSYCPAEGATTGMSSERWSLGQNAPRQFLSSPSEGTWPSGRGERFPVDEARASPRKVSDTQEDFDDDIPTETQLDSLPAVSSETEKGPAASDDATSVASSRSSDSVPYVARSPSVSVGTRPHAGEHTDTSPISSAVSAPSPSSLPLVFSPQPSVSSSSLPLSSSSLARVSSSPQPSASSASLPLSSSRQSGEALGSSGAASSESSRERQGKLRLRHPRQRKPFLLQVLHAEHRCHNPRELARVQRAGGSIFAGRVGGVLEPSRSVGDFDVKDAQPPGVLIATPEVCRVKVRKPTLVLLGTDGVWDMLCSADVLACVKKVTQFWQLLLAAFRERMEELQEEATEKQENEKERGEGDQVRESSGNGKGVAGRDVGCGGKETPCGPEREERRQRLKTGVKADVLSRISEELIKVARRRGSDDDATCLAVFLNPAPADSEETPVSETAGRTCLPLFSGGGTGRRAKKEKDVFCVKDNWIA
ncbi:protein phosphatase 2C domain-containing protein [Toxoplasma gondii RUB]|uniref:Protein phosphatase 2C domain-containing protein n=1 Tax=Toxoplasma gondii RUB TaxID=935652 RepID=A0A086M0C5_TOXGO|nr:protein phosphatase 2C domain-containing protein [Toxoplasma gondii RUB]